MAARTGVMVARRPAGAGCWPANPPTTGAPTRADAPLRLTRENLGSPWGATAPGLEPTRGTCIWEAEVRELHATKAGPALALAFDETGGVR